VTAGFYSKDLIISSAWTSPMGSPVLWAAGLAGAFLTSLYTFRMVFVTFFGEARHPSSFKPHWPMHLPLAVLSILSIAGGFVAVPSFLKAVLPETPAVPGLARFETASEIATALGFLLGLGLAYFFYLRAPRLEGELIRNSFGAALHRWWLAGWGFDWVYDRLLVRPFMWFARENKDDAVDLIYQGTAETARQLYRALSATETGRVRWYAMGIAAGAVITIAVAVLLWY
jgi:NADH-quinone oxidoreductase subunit L